MNEVGFCPVVGGVLSCGVLSVWGFVLWGFVSVGFCPVGFCQCGVLSCGVLSILQFGRVPEKAHIGQKGRKLDSQPQGEADF